MSGSMANYSQTSVSPVAAVASSDRVASCLFSSDMSDRRGQQVLDALGGSLQNQSTPMWEKLLGAGKSTDLVSEEVVNWIISVAQYHNAVDSDKSKGTVLGSIKVDLEQGLNKYLNKHPPTKEQLEGDIDNLVNALVAKNSFKAHVEKLHTDLDGKTSVPSDDELKKALKNVLQHDLSSKSNDGVTQIDSTKNQQISDAFDAKEAANQTGGAIDTQLMADRLYGSIKNILSRNFRVNHTMVGGSAESSALLTNVYKRWDTLSSEDQALFSRYMQLVDETGADAQSKIDSCNADKLRVNIKKETGGDITVFEKDLPYIPRSFTHVMVGAEQFKLEQPTSNSDVNVECCPGGNKLLQRIYRAVRKGEKTVTISGVAAQLSSPVPATRFTGNTAQDFIAELHRTARATSTDAASTDANLGASSYLSMTDRNVWARAAPGVYTKTVNGVTVRYGAEDDATRKLLKASNKCYSTLTNGDAAQCENYIWKCLLDNDSKSLEWCLQDRMLQGDFYQISRDEVSNMHPLVALKTLQKFGFREVSTYDYTYGSQIRKVETKDHWLASDSLKEKFSTEQLAAIKGSDRLLNYLDLVSQFVNANPQVLNSGFAGTTDEQTGHVRVADRLSSLGLKARVEPDRSSQGFAYRRLGTNMQTSFYGKTYSNSPFVPNSRGMLVTQAAGWSGRTPGLTATAQSGGGASVILRSFNEGAEGQSGAAYISQLVRSQLNDLPQSGRRLDDASRREIDRLLANLSKDEQTLMQIVALLEDYNRALSANREYKSETVTFSKMNDLVAKHKRVSTRHFNDQVSVQKMLASLCDTRSNGDNYTGIDMTR